MNDDERTDRDHIADLIHKPDCGCGGNARHKSHGWRDEPAPDYYVLVDAVLSSEWLKSHDVGVAVAATRKEQEEIAIALDAEQATSNRSADSAGSRGSYERATQIGMVADAYGRAAALVRARGIAAVADVVDSQSHED